MFKVFNGGHNSAEGWWHDVFIEDIGKVFSSKDAKEAAMFGAELKVRIAMLSFSPKNDWAAAIKDLCSWYNKFPPGSFSEKDSIEFMAIYNRLKDYFKERNY